MTIWVQSTRNLEYYTNNYFGLKIKRKKYLGPKQLIGDRNS